MVLARFRATWIDLRVAHQGPGGRQLRHRPVGHRRHHRHTRTHHLRQRQVLRDLEVLADGAARPGPPHPELRASIPKEFIRDLWVTIANGQIWRGEIRNRAKDGSLYWVDTTIVPFLDDRGKPYQYMALRYEITARKTSEERLREQEALARLGQMAAVVAHEVKNPIAGIRGRAAGHRLAHAGRIARQADRRRHHRASRRAQRHRPRSARLRQAAPASRSSRSTSTG